MSNAFRSAPPSRRTPSTRRSPLYPVPAKHSPSQRSSKQNPKQRSLHSVPKAATSLRAISAPAPRVATVKQLPIARALPLWLRLLIQAQRGSLVVTFVLVTATLIVYGSTVYTQQLWGKEYRKLKTLTRNEREMLATSATLEDQLALQAKQPGSGLVPQTPDSTIFLQPALQRSALSASASVSKAAVTPNTPLGY